MCRQLQASAFLQMALHGLNLCTPAADQPRIRIMVAFPRLSQGDLVRLTSGAPFSPVAAAAADWAAPLAALPCVCGLQPVLHRGGLVVPACLQARPRLKNCMLCYAEPR
jgi:hypothetical protein